MRGFTAFGVVVLGAAFSLSATGKSPILEAVREPPCILPSGYHSEFRFRPNCSGEMYAGSRHAMVHFNSAGVRGKEYSSTPAPGTFRILLLGASNVLGVGLPEEGSLPFLLERELGSRFEVINGAVNGYCTWQAALRARELTRLYRPQLVLYNVGLPACFMTDLAWGVRMDFSPAGDPLGFDRSLFGPATPSFINKIYYSKTAFPYLYVLNDGLRRLALFWKLRLFHASAPEAVLESQTVRGLKYLERAATEEGARFCSFTHPSVEPVVSQYIPFGMPTGPARVLQPLQPSIKSDSDAQVAELRRQKVPLLYLEHYVMQSQPDDAHPTAASTADWARQLAGALRDAGLTKAR